MPHENFSACYNINSKYLGITYDKIKAVEILEDQSNTCQKSNKQFCSLNTPLQPLTNPLTCIAALHPKNKAGIEKRCSLLIRHTYSVNIINTQTPIHILQLPPACTATSQHYATYELIINISLHTANLNVINISSPEFRIWQHLEDHWNETQLYHLTNIPSVPIDKLYKTWSAVMDPSLHLYQLMSQ